LLRRADELLRTADQDLVHLRSYEHS
jgi:hypothetical protein